MFTKKKNWKIQMNNMTLAPQPLPTTIMSHFFIFQIYLDEVHQFVIGKRIIYNKIIQSIANIVRRGCLQDQKA